MEKIKIQEVKVNLGCGPRAKEDWVNLDWGALAFVSRVPALRRLLISQGLLSSEYAWAWPSNLRLYDCRKRLPFEDACVDFVYSSHFLEHLHRFEAVRILRDCHRILRPNGKIRIVVPDVEILVSKYLVRDKSLFERSEQIQTMGDLFVATFYGFHSDRPPQGLVERLQRRFVRGHLWMYDFESLSAILSGAGFTQVRKCSAGEGDVPDLAYLDIHPKISLHVEATKIADGESA